MDNIRKEFIKEVLETLKIPSGAFNIGTMSDEIKHIPDTSLRAFHKALFGTDHSYLNGMDRIVKVAEQFKPVVIDNVEQEAKELIELCEGLNTQIGNDAKRMGEDFKKLVYSAKFPTLDNDKIVVLNNVKPHNDFRDLIIHIRHYQTAQDSLEAFKRAILYVNKSLTAIESKQVRKMICG